MRPRCLSWDRDWLSIPLFDLMGALGALGRSCYQDLAG